MTAPTRHPDYLRCRHCGRRKAWYTSRTHFGEGCKVNPQGFHSYTTVEWVAEGITMTSQDYREAIR